MPFHLSNPALVQRQHTNADRHSSIISAVLQQCDKFDLLQCEGITKAGHRCNITSKTEFRDGSGRLVGGPLRHGSRVCLLHSNLFCTVPVHEPSEFVVFFIDLETSGLDVLHDEVLEIAITAHLSCAQYSTTVLPVRLPEGPGVHGIDQDELLSGVTFACGFNRMVAFLQTIINDTMFNRFDSQNVLMDNHCETDSLSQQTFCSCSRPIALLAGHNGLKFDFPMLVSECIRHGCDIRLLTEFYFCDTLQLTRVFSGVIGDSCSRLQCLARCCHCCTKRQHRALEDTLVLSSVVQHCADYVGVPVHTLLSQFARRFDVEATLATRRCLS